MYLCVLFVFVCICGVVSCLSIVSLSPGKLRKLRVLLEKSRSQLAKYKRYRAKRTKQMKASRLKGLTEDLLGSPRSNNKCSYTEDSVNEQWTSFEQCMTELGKQDPELFEKYFGTFGMLS